MTMLRAVLWVLAVLLVGVGAVSAFSGWQREAAPGLLIVGIVYAVTLLIIGTSASAKGGFSARYAPLMAVLG